MSMKLTDMMSIKGTGEKPSLIIANTIKGKGVSIMENNPNWHFRIPRGKELAVFRKELDILDNELELK